MLSQRDRHRLQAVARLAPAGPTMVVAASPNDDSLEVARLALAAGRKAPLGVVGAFRPLALRAALALPDLYGRIRASIGQPTALSRERHPPAALIFLSAAGLNPAGVKAHANAWARHLRAGGYLTLWGGHADSPGDLGITPAYWETYGARGGIELIRRRPVG